MSARLRSSILRRWRDLSRAERLVLWSFLVVPAVLFVIPALVGHPAIDADNLIQNYPLRFLVGREVRSGHLPLFNPYTNSGTPLLGGMNAGAFFPLTALFVFLPGIAAWVLNLIAVYAISAVGVYVLARGHGLSLRSGAIAAYAYTYGGAMIGQVVHLGVVQGFALLPWLMWLLTALARRLSRTESSARSLLRASSPYVLFGAGLWGLIFLTGEPRAIAEAEIVYLVAAPVILLMRSSYRPAGLGRAGAYLATLAVGGVWGAGVAMAQLLPGWSFIHASERAHITYSFYGAGSLAPRWSLLYLVPDLFGGNGSVGTAFFASYNLPEVTVYVGLVALIAGFAFVSRFTWRGWRAGDRDYVVYLALAVTGLLASWGNDVVVGHVFHAIPLFGSTRLPSRNGVLVDFGFAMLLAWWIHHLEGADRRAYGLAGWRRLVTALPALAVIATALAVIAAGPRVVRDLGVRFNVHDATLLAPVMWIRVALALAALALVTVLARRRRLVEAVAFVVVVDLVLFSFLDATGLVGGVGPTQPSRAYAASVLGTKGRFALVDIGGVHTASFRRLGEPNMNIFTGLSSMQGYGSLVADYYGTATGTHPQNGLSACHLADGDFAQLRLSAVAISSSLLVNNTAFPPNAVPSGCVVRRASTSDVRYLGQVLSLHAVTLRSAHPTGAWVTVQPIDSSGATIDPALRSRLGAATTLTFSRDVRAAGFEMTSSTKFLVDGASVLTTSGARYTLNSDFQLALDRPTWHLRSVDGTFAVFHSPVLVPRFSASPTASLTDGTTGAWGNAAITVTTTSPVTLVRSEAYLPGWRASATSPSGHVVALNVARHGLVQSVEVPAGTWRVRFHYHAPYIEAGLIGSAFSSAAGLALAWWLLKERRARLATMHS